MTRRLVVFVLSLMLANIAWQNQADAGTGKAVSVKIDISSQTMAVHVNGWPHGRWRVSTARRGYHTPRGSYRPYLLKKMHYSSKYENSPMPNSIFFLGGYAIHGTHYVRSLGRPVSHGCIRLAPQHAARLYHLVKKHGMGSTRIRITN